MPDSRTGDTSGAAGPGGHHSGEQRNVVKGDPGRGGKDIFHAAVLMTRMPMCLADPNQEDSPLVFANKAFEELTGYEEAEILGRNCRFLQGPDTDRDMVAEVSRKLAAREDVSLELFNYRKDGTGFWNALYISPVYDEAGNLLYFFASQLDVTKRKEAEMMLRQSQRMEAIGSMAASVAHEFNNLMTVVMGSLEQAQQQPQTERLTRILARAAWGAERAGRLTHQMLSFSRRQFHDSRPEEVNELIRTLDGLIAQVADAGIDVEFVLSEEPLPVVVDAGQFELAVLNLARNAADAMPDGGKLIVSTRAQGGDGQAGGGQAGDGRGGGQRYVAVTLADTGHGMPPEVAQRATEPFFTTKAKGKGTGLGLSMVQGFAEQSGGRLEIDSAPDHGTSITILLPRTEKPPRAEDTPPA